MDDVVAAAVAKQVPEHADAEDQRRPDPALAAVAVERHARPGDDDAHAGDLAALAPRHWRSVR